MTTHTIPISAFDFYYLARGDKHFLTIPDPAPGIKYGDVLQLLYLDQTLVRRVVYVESTRTKYVGDHVCIELAV